VRGINQGQFRTPLSRLAAYFALATVDPAAAQKQTLAALDLESLGIPDLILAAAIELGFGGSVPDGGTRVEQALMSRAFTQPVPIGDAAEAATLAIFAQPIADRIALGSPNTSPEEQIVALCRRRYYRYR
jgi:hypothetical protein